MRSWGICMAPDEVKYIDFYAQHQDALNMK